MENVEAFFDRPAVRQSLALFGLFLVLLGMLCMVQAYHEKAKDIVEHSTKLVNMIVPNWPWKNPSGELILPWMDPNSEGIRIMCDHGGIFIGQGEKRWSWTDSDGYWKWPWN